MTQSANIHNLTPITLNQMKGQMLLRFWCCLSDNGHKWFTQNTHVDFCLHETPRI